jgi:hypothetical protein
MDMHDWYVRRHGVLNTFLGAILGYIHPVKGESKALVVALIAEETQRVVRLLDELDAAHNAQFEPSPEETTGDVIPFKPRR